MCSNEIHCVRRGLLGIAEYGVSSFDWAPLVWAGRGQNPQDVERCRRELLNTDYHELPSSGPMIPEILGNYPECRGETSQKIRMRAATATEALRLLRSVSRLPIAGTPPGEPTMNQVYRHSAGTCETKVSDGAILEGRGSKLTSQEQADLEHVIKESETEVVVQEQEDISRAVLLSKQDKFSSDGVVLWRLTKHSPQLFTALLESPELSPCRHRVEDAGCEMRPAWASGALLLVPLTMEQHGELGFKLERHHVLALDDDLGALEAALQNVPNRRRPQVRPDHRASDLAAVVDDASEERQHCIDDVPCLHIERTFYAFTLPKIVTEVSSSCLVQSDPSPRPHDKYTGRRSVEVGLHAQNPRRWG